MNKKKKYHVKGFTIVEVLVTLALTAIAIAFAYTTLTYVQKLFAGYKQQNRFINEYTDFKNRMSYESINAQTIIETTENKLIINRDSVTSELELLEKVILIKKAGACDTFHFSPKKIKKEFEPLNSSGFSNKLIKTLTFEIEYTKQKFNFYFYKNYDASVKLNLCKTD